MPFKPKGEDVGIDKLRSILNQTGLSRDNNALYQFCDSLLRSVDKNFVGIQAAVTEVKTAVAGAIPILPPPVAVGETHYDAPLSDGDLIAADLIYAAGECIIVQVPI